MAIRTSNQITFTEQRRILEIKEWYLATNLDTNITTDTDGWTETIQTTNATNRYLWNYEEVVYSIGEPEKSLPVIIGVYGSVSDIINYYAITEKPIAPDITSSDWTDKFSDVAESLSSTNKYLWNYEIIVYADGSTSDPQPAIIGVYGDSGKDAISFKIYSTVGFEFVDDIDEEEKLETIKLQLSSFEGNKPLTGCVYTWYWWNPDLNDGKGDFEKIEGHIETSSAEFEVNINDKYAFSNLKCEMTFAGNTGEPYVDYVTLSKKVDVYSAAINFFEGTNVFSPGKDYIVAYINLYKNGQIEETVKTSNYYTGLVEIDTNDPTIINTEYKPEHYVYSEGVNETTTGTYYVLIDGEYVEKTLPDDYIATDSYYIYVDYDEENTFLTYFIHSTDNGYEVVLGGYDFNTAIWTVQSFDPIYVYSTNNISLEEISNTFVVSKNNVARSKDIDVYVYKNTDVDKNTDNEEIALNESSFVASTKATIIDLNDTIVSAEQPENPYEGQLWLDLTSNTLKVYTNGAWEVSLKQIKGKAIHTSIPSTYEKGDLWIVSAEDAATFGENSPFTEGSMWRADNNSGSAGFNEDDWIDANKTLTEMKNNIYQHFSFDPTNGLKIQQTDGEFYVNINSQRMGFYYTGDIDNEEIDTSLKDDEVVYIGTNSARIRNLVVEGSADFNSEISVDSQISIVNIHGTDKTNAGFNFKIEPNGSFSLVRVEVE